MARSSLNESQFSLSSHGSVTVLISSSFVVVDDLKKDFHTVDRDILLHKCYRYGSRGVVKVWFRSYLSERIQTTEIGHDITFIFQDF